MMFTKERKLALLPLIFILIMTFIPTVMAAPLDPQIVEDGSRALYFDRDGNVNNTGTWSEGDILSVRKTISPVETGVEGVYVENEFDVELAVETSVDIKESILTPDATAVLVIDLSTSLDGEPPTVVAPGGPIVDTVDTVHIEKVKDAAVRFINDFKAGRNADRYLSVVIFGRNAKILSDWVDASDETAMAELLYEIGRLGSLDTVAELGGAFGGTNLEAALQLTRNLLDKDEFANSGMDHITNNNVILLSDGGSNYAVKGAVKLTYLEQLLGKKPSLDYTTVTDTAKGTEIYGAIAGTSEFYTGRPDVPQSLTDADLLKYVTESMLDEIKNDEQSVNSNIFTVAFEPVVPKDSTAAWAEWLGNTISSGANYTYSAGDDELDDAFASILSRIESWSESWVLTDSVGEGIEFISEFTAGNGLSKDGNVLTWDLKEATPAAGDNDVYTYKYKIRLNTLSEAFAADADKIMSVSNAAGTTLTYKVLVEDQSHENWMSTQTAQFGTPVVKGFAEDFTFSKIGNSDKDVLLNGATFTIAKGAYEKEATSATADNVAGVVKFNQIPSGHTFTLTETGLDLDEEFEDIYEMSKATYNVKVSFGELTLTKVEDNVETDVPVAGFAFSNPMKGQNLYGFVSPYVYDRLSYDEEFLKGFEIEVELREEFWLPRDADDNPETDPEDNLYKTTVKYDDQGNIGRFDFENIPMGRYVLTIKRPGYLVRPYRVIVDERGGTELITSREVDNDGNDVFELIAGDVNLSDYPDGDWVIDDFDIGAMTNVIGQTYEDADYEAKFDLNADGVINQADLIIIMGTYDGTLGWSSDMYPGVVEGDIQFFED